MLVMGIDPGLSGAVAGWDGEGLTLLEIPTVKSSGRGREVLWAALSYHWDQYFVLTEHAYLERVMSRPGEGVSSAFKFGCVFGGLRAILACKQVPYTLVTPSKWMKAMGVGRGSKEASVIRATELFPQYANRFRGPRGGIRDGLAEAALIALYGYNNFNLGSTHENDTNP